MILETAFLLNMPDVFTKKRSSLLKTDSAGYKIKRRCSGKIKRRYPGKAQSVFLKEVANKRQEKVRIFLHNGFLKLVWFQII
jgi:hypothetical protein